MLGNGINNNHLEKMMTPLNELELVWLIR